MQCSLNAGACRLLRNLWDKYVQDRLFFFFTSASARRDFKLKNVVSINASGHKFGLVYPGVGWCIFRSKAFLPESLVFHDNYLGTDQISFTLNFSKGASQMRTWAARAL